MTTVSDMTPEEFSKAITDALIAAGISSGHSGAPSKSDSGFNPHSSKHVSAFMAAVAKGTDGMKDYVAKMKKVSQNAGVLADQLDLLDEAIEQATEDSEKHALRKQKAALQEINATETVTKAQTDAAFQMGQQAKALAKNFGQAGATFLKSAQGGGSGIALAADAMTAGVELVGGSVTAAGAGLASVGAAGMSVNKTWGKVALIGGKIVEAIGSAGTAASKFLITFLTKEAEKSVKVLGQMSSSGALFADGMSAVRNAAVETGLSMETLGNITKNNSAQLSGAGLGMSAGFKKMADTLNKGGPQFKSNLLNLGYTLEEQGELVAQTMADLRRVGKNVGKMSGGEIAEATEKYAENLRIISAITGEDAKAKMDQARDAASSASMQAELNNMEGTQREQFLADLATVPASMKKAVMQQRLLGVVTDKQSQIMMASAPGMQRNIEAMANNLGHGADVMGEIVGQSAQDMKEAQKKGGILDIISKAGLAGVGGLPGEVDSFITGLNKELQKGIGDPEAAKAQIEAVRLQKKTTDELTNSLGRVQVQTEEFKSSVEKIAMSALPKFGNMLESVIKQINSAINPSVWDSVSSAVGDVVGLVGSAAASFTGTVLAGGGAIGTTTAATGTAAASTTVAATAAAETAVAAGTTATAATGMGAAMVGFIAALPAMLMGAATVAADTAEIGGTNLNPFNATANAGMSFSKAFSGVFGSSGDDAERKKIQTGIERGNVYSATEAADIKKRLGLDVPQASMAAGGIASGSSSGFMAMLHGTEAVIPLPDGNKIPVDLGSAFSSAMQSSSIDTPFTSITSALQTVFSDIKTALTPPTEKPQPTSQETDRMREVKVSRDEQLDVLKQQLEMMKQFVDKADQLISEARDQKSLTQGILNAAY